MTAGKFFRQSDSVYADAFLKANERDPCHNDQHVDENEARFSFAGRARSKRSPLRGANKHFDNIRAAI